MERCEKEIPLSIVLPSNWRSVRHPDYQMVDEIRISLKERWKESELSGDEWRFSYITEYMHKGLVLYSKGNSGEIQYPVLGVGAGLMHVQDDGVCDAAFKLEETVCAQPGCRNPATRFYRVKALYDNAGNKEELPRSHDREGTVYVIRFCGRHLHRGDCGLQDADHNYEAIALPEPPK